MQSRDQETRWSSPAMARCAVLAALLLCSSCGAEPEPPKVPDAFQVVAGTQWGTCELSWSPPPGGVDGYEVATSVSSLDWWFTEGVYGGGFVPPEMTRAEVGFSRNLAELSHIEIKIRSLRGSLTSEFSPAGDCMLLPYDPSYAVTTLEDDGIRVNWLNSSLVATTIEIEKTALDASGAPGVWSPLTTMPPDRYGFHSSYLDTAVAVGTAYGYRVTAVAGSDRSPSSETRSLQLGPPLATTTIQLPRAPHVATDGNGNYAFASFGSGTFPGLSIAWGNGTAWNEVRGLDAMPYDRVIKLDAAGLPHAVYGKPPTSGFGVVITHGWSDGTQWLEESIAQRTLAGDSATPQLLFDVDAAGRPAILWSLGQERFEVAIKTGAVWTVTPLDSLIPADPFGITYSVFMDQAGTPHVLAAEVDVISHLEARNGVWTREALPLTRGEFTPWSRVVGAGRDPDHLAICVEAGGAFPAQQVGCIRKSPAGWGSLERVGNLEHTSHSLESLLTLSRDGTRLGVLLNNGNSRVYRSALAGAWTQVVVNPIGSTGLFPRPVLGFDAAGKLFVLSGGGEFLGTNVVSDYRLEREP